MSEPRSGEPPTPKKKKAEPGIAAERPEQGQRGRKIHSKETREATTSGEVGAGKKKKRSGGKRRRLYEDRAGW